MKFNQLSQFAVALLLCQTGERASEAIQLQYISSSSSGYSSSYAYSSGYQCSNCYSSLLSSQVQRVLRGFIIQQDLQDAIFLKDDAKEKKKPEKDAKEKKQPEKDAPADKKIDFSFFDTVFQFFNKQLAPVLQYDKANQNLITEESALKALEECKKIGDWRKKAESAIVVLAYDKQPVLVDKTLMELCENVVQALAEVEMEEDIEEDKKDQGEKNKTDGGANQTVRGDNKTAVGAGPKKGHDDKNKSEEPKAEHGDKNKSSEANRTRHNESTSLNKSSSDNSSVSIATITNKANATDKVTDAAGKKSVSIPVGGEKPKDDEGAK